MRIHFSKKSLGGVLAAGSLALAMSVYGQPLEPRYTLDEVIEACENAYGNGQQIDQCIINVCGTYGCTDW